MFDFSGDEWFFFLAAAVVSLVGIFRKLAPITSASFRGTKSPAALLLASPILGLIVTYAVLQTWSDTDVRGHLDYILLFIVGAAAWMITSLSMMAFLGFSARDDVAERGNLAAAVAIGGAVLAVGFIYAFSNVGSGPTIWTTIAPAFVASLALGAVCLVIELVGRTVADNITIDRDVASGFRLAGALVGSALILGRAAGGALALGPKLGQT
jgi:uncharacterized membrane protein YjfL (UPF0719 family)